MTRTRRTWLVGIATASIVVAANASEGAYFSQSWGWVALAFLMPTAVVLVLGLSERPGVARTAFAALMGGLGAWIALSALWSLSPAGSLREVERMLVYVALALALALLLRRGDATGIVGGLLVGATVVSGYGLATRLFPDWLESYDDPTLPYRLSEPIGYWNALGLLSAMGVLVAAGVLAHGRRLEHRVVAGAAMPLLVATLYFTFSRGAWAALAIGVVASVAVDPRRLRLLFSLLVVAPASVVAVAVASRQDALTTEDAPIDDAVTQGHGLAVVLAVLSLSSGALAALGALVASRVEPSHTIRRALDVALAAAVAVAVVVGVAALGGPREAVRELDRRFDTAIVVEDPDDLNARVFSLSGNGRAEHIRVAWDAAREQIVVGDGAGTYEYHWYLRRDIAFAVRDAHSLYAEMLAEVGVVGLTLLALALLSALVASVSARRARLVPAATGAYVAWLAHSAMDWHWEVVGVSMAAMLAGGVGLLASERGLRQPLSDAARRPVLGVVVVLSVVATWSLVGNQALFAAREAVTRKDWVDAVRHADRARDLLFWSFEPEVVLGDASAGLGDRSGAVAAYREAVERDPENWTVWLRLAQVTSGAERGHAYARVHALNPLERNLPGETDASG